ncbi:hypothetical protein FS749_012680, partial [Ceratobasidium sp. UAMH 11750]
MAPRKPETSKPTSKTPATDKGLKRNRTETSRAKQANADQAATEAARAKKRREKQARRQQLEEEEEEDLFVEHEDETEREAQLR